MQVNVTTQSGYLGSDVKLRTLRSGTPVASMRLGQSYEFTDATGTRRHTNWFTVVAYGPTAKIAQRFRKGDNVIVQGQLQSREWHANDNSKRVVTEIIARTVGRVAPLEGPHDDTEPETLPTADPHSVAAEGPDDDWPTTN